MTSKGPVKDISLSAKASSGARWSLFAQVGARIASFLTTLILARIIDPGDFGIWAAASAVMQILLTVNDVGLPTALLRWQGDIQRPARTALTLTLAASATVALPAFFFAPRFAQALDKPSAAGLIRWLVLAIVIDTMAGIPGVELAREFRQDKRLLADMAAVPVSFIVTIGLALAGFGPFSLAAGFLLGSLTTLIVLHRVAPYRVTPGFDRAHARDLLRVGFPLSISTLVTAVVFNVDYVIVGRELGAEALGTYFLAFSISNWLINLVSVPIQRVSLALFSRLQADPPRLTMATRNVLFAVTGVAVPISLVMSLGAIPLILFLYTDKWEAAAQPLVFLAFFGVARVLQEVLFDVLVAVGLVKRLMMLKLVWLIVLVPSLVIGARWNGLAGVGLAQMLVASVVVIPLTLAAVSRTISLRAVTGFMPRLVLAASGAVAAWYMIHGVLDAPPPLRMVVESLVIFIAFFAISGAPLLRLLGDAGLPPVLRARMRRG